jgi:hypothetical protein
MRVAAPGSTRPPRSAPAMSSSRWRAVWAHCEVKPDDAQPPTRALQVVALRLVLGEPR